MVNEQKQCRRCGSSFQISKEEVALLQKSSPVIGGKTYQLPMPTTCFQCNLQQRLAFYNCRSLYKRKCDITNKEIVSIHGPNKPFTVYEHNYWWSDKWDPLDYGRDIDFSRPIFPQIRELMESVPHIALAVLSTNVNCDFTNDNYKTKNCYLVFDGEQAENAYYGHTFVGLKDCIDFLAVQKSELCYECTHCYECYRLRHSQFCHNCSESWFLRDCIGCKDCFGCANLHQKQYCIFNEQKTKAEYESFIAKFDSRKHSHVQKMKAKAEEFFSTQPVKATRGVQNVNSSGDNISQCKDSEGCFDCNGMQDCRGCTDCLMSAKDCYRVHIWGDGMELVYNSALVGAQSRNLIGDYYVLIGCHDVYYSQWCSRSSNNLFGCIGLRHKEYCVFNKQYSKEEYEKLVPKIIEHMQQTGEWGEFYPPEISAFGYNDTMAQSFFPLKKEEALAKGFQWSDYEAPLEAEKTISADQLPDDISDIPDDVLNWAIICEKTGKPFRIIKQELLFYRSQKLPFPRKHPDQRHFDRFAFKNPYRLWDRKCDKCSKKIQTAYDPERQETVFCEECYLKEVY